MTELKNDRSYIKTLLKIAIPMMVQNGISNFVNLLDNLMIGSIGTNAISGVGIANQLMFVFFLVIFGATAGVGIFTAQYKGKGDTEGIRYSFRFKLVFNAILSAICTLFFVLYSRHLINLFLLGEADNPADAAEALEIGVKYIHIILISLIPVGLTQAYGGTLRDLGNTKVPMFASVAAIFVNLIGNWLLIYGHFGLPAMGAEGAAIATVASRFVELAILIIYTGKHPDLFPFIKGAFKHFHVPGRLAGRFILRALPLMANETIAMGEAVGIMIGHILGSGELEDAKKKAGTMRRFTVLCGLVFGLLLAGISFVFPLLYNTTDEIRSLATVFILIAAANMPFCAYTHASYFIIRSGGNALITVLFDSVFTWVIVVPLAAYMSYFTGISIILMVAIIRATEIIKCLIAFAFVRSGIWVRNIVNK